MLHVHHKDGKVVYEMWQNSFVKRLAYHGLYSGPGSVTKSGEEGAEDYDYTYKPIDIADAIAKKHDQDYDDVYQNGLEHDFGSLNFLEARETLTADREMVKRVNKALKGMLTFRSFDVEDVKDKPVYTGFNFETLFALLGQRILIGALATYKAWKKEGIYNGSIKREDDFGTVGKKFMRKYPLTGLLRGIVYRKAPEDESERLRDGNLQN